jgi:hypothetical protein
MNKSRVSDGPHRRIECASHETDSAARWRRLEQTMMEARKQFSSLQADELQAIIDEAVTTSRQAP